MKTTTFPCISRAFARNILQPLLSLLNIQSAPPTIGQNEPQVGGMIVSASIEPTKSLAPFLPSLYSQKNNLCRT